MAELADILNRISGSRDALIARYEKALTIEEGRSGGDDRTVVRIDVLLPDVTSALPASPFDDAGSSDGRNRWRMRASSADRKLRVSSRVGPASALAAYHGAAPEKGRRVLVTDLDAGQVAAYMAWHFQAGPVGERSRRQRKPPHLVVSAGVLNAAAGELRGAYTAMLWQLFLLVAAIDRCTVRRGRVGVHLDGRVLLTPSEFHALGLRPGPARRFGGHSDKDYFELVL